MKIEKNSIIKLEDNKSYLVDDIKIIEGREIALLQDLNLGIFVFAIEQLNKKGESHIVLVPDREAQMGLAKKFDEVDGL